MQSRLLLNGIILKLIFLILLNFGCVEERKEIFRQGQGIGLFEIRDYQNKRIPLTTGNIIAHLPASNAENFDTDQKIINQFHLVEFQTKAEFVKNEDFPFRGKENYQYEIMYKVSKNLLKIYKVGLKEMIPSQEWTYGEPQEDGKLAIPLFAYQIALVRVEKEVDHNGDEAHFKVEVPVDYKTEVRVNNTGNASHFRLVSHTRIDFESIVKKDILPADFFDGEWFYSATIVSTSIEGHEFVGSILTASPTMNGVSRIKFIKIKDQLKGVDLNIFNQIDETNDLNWSSAIEIPIDPIDFRTKPFQFREEVITDSTLNAVSSKERSYIRLHLTRTKSGVKQNPADIKLLNFKLSKDYVSYTVQYLSGKIIVRYALRRAGDPIPQDKRRKYFKEDQKKFGLFKAEKNTLYNVDIFRQEDITNNIYLRRFFPKDNKIVFHFTKNSAEEFKSIAVEAVKRWNKAFELAQTGITLSVNQKVSVDLGDNRYKAINIVDDSSNTDTRTGLGPFVVDSTTGEIISATANIFVNSHRQELTSFIRNFVYSQLGMFDLKHVTKTNLPPIIYQSTNKNFNWPMSRAFSNNVLPYQRTFFNSLLTENKEERGFLNQYFYQNKEDKNNSKTIYNDFLSLFPLNARKGFLHTCSFSHLGHDIVEEVQKGKICPNLLVYIKELQQRNEGKTKLITHTEDEKKIFKECAEKLLPSQLMVTILHELGHNLGLRHNFMASADKDNFYDEKDSNSKAQFSSVMDYSAPFSKELNKPGKYDIAAISFAYAGKVELENGELINLDTSKSLSQNSELKGKKFKKYMYCGPEDLMYKDPLCNMFDEGVTPLEIVENIIKTYDANYAVGYYLYDRPYNYPAKILRKTFLTHTLLPLKRFYDQWRIHLTDFVGSDNKYLEKFTEEEFEGVLERMSSSVLKEEYNLYRPAALKVYEFLKKLSVLPNRYCVLKNKDTHEMKVTEFSTIRENFYLQTKENILSCSNKSVVEFLASQNQELVKELGYPIDDVKNSTDIDKPIEVIGNQFDRKSAILFLTQRTPPTSYLLKETEFFPGFLDEPPFRREVGEIIENRIFKGVSTKEWGIKGLSDQKDPYYPRYAKERKLIMTFFPSYLCGLRVPFSTIGQDRIFPYTSMAVDRYQFIERGEVGVKISNSYYVAKKDQPFTIAAVSKLKQQKQIDQVDAPTVLSQEELMEFFNKFNIPKDYEEFKTITTFDLSQITAAMYMHFQKDNSPNPTSPMGPTYSFANRNGNDNVANAEEKDYQNKSTLFNAVSIIVEQETSVFYYLQNSLPGRSIYNNNMHRPFIEILPQIEKVFKYDLDDSFHLENIQIRVGKFVDSQSNGKVTLIEEDIIKDDVERNALISIITLILQNVSKMNK